MNRSSLDHGAASSWLLPLIVATSTALIALYAGRRAVVPVPTPSPEAEIARWADVVRITAGTWTPARRLTPPFEASEFRVLSSPTVGRPLLFAFEGSLGKVALFDLQSPSPRWTTLPKRYVRFPDVVAADDLAFSIIGFEWNGPATSSRFSYAGKVLEEQRVHLPSNTNWLGATGPMGSKKIHLAAGLAGDDFAFATVPLAEAGRIEWKPQSDRKFKAIAVTSMGEVPVFWAGIPNVRIFARLFPGSFLGNWFDFGKLYGTPRNLIGSNNYVLGAWLSSQHTPATVRLRLRPDIRMDAFEADAHTSVAPLICPIGTSERYHFVFETEGQLASVELGADHWAPSPVSPLFAGREPLACGHTGPAESVLVYRDQYGDLAMTKFRIDSPDRSVSEKR